MFEEKLNQYKNEYEKLLEVAAKFENIFKEAENICEYGSQIFEEYYPTTPAKEAKNKYRNKIIHLLHLLDTDYNSIFYHTYRKENIEEIIQDIKNIKPTTFLKETKDWYKNYITTTKNSIKFNRGTFTHYSSIRHIFQIITILQTNNFMSYEEAISSNLTSKIYDLLKNNRPFVYKNCKIETYKKGGCKITFADTNLLKKYMEVA